MAKAELKVYLDHHIRRDNLLYKRAEKPVGATQEQPKYLTIQDLYGVRPKARLLKKPDFQRATWAWSPDDCVDLLESVLNEQVVPSVIMWLSPDGSQYVLDGGHRISVLLAWVKDDWGDKLPSEAYKDKILENVSKAAAQKVRELLREREIGLFEEYLAAEERYVQLETQLGRAPSFGEMDAISLRYAELVRKWEGVNIGFPILWVKGDYEKAEESFLKINKTGRRLSDWETKLVENRSSSFARTVMSITQVLDAEHCWPVHDLEIEKDNDLKNRATTILQGVRALHDLLFTPEYTTPIKEPVQPLLATPFTKPELKPAYLAELLTITEGKKGQRPETEALIRRDKKSSPRDIIKNGQKLVENALDVLGNIYGNSPRSMMLMPLVYFYNGQGVYVRSLLYGMLFWLNHGSENKEVLNRKRVFSAYRGAFENVLIENKDVIIRRIARRIGSGPEVTYPTARYFEGLLKLLIKHQDAADSADFRHEHEELLETLGKAKVEVAEQVEPTVDNTARFFRGRERSGVNVRDYLTAFPKCEICGGRYWPGLFTQVDHVQQHAKGGKTVLNNARNTHPFCNNSRDEIEGLRAGTLEIELPVFDNPEDLPKSDQLSFLSLWENEIPENEDAYDELLFLEDAADAADAAEGDDQEPTG